MINIVKYCPEDGLHAISAEELQKWDYKSEERIWVDIYDNPEEENYEILK